jgi:hypothetical protein
MVNIGITLLILRPHTTRQSVANLETLFILTRKNKTEDKKTEIWKE